MTAAAAPSPEKVLRELFWKLLFRGRASIQAAGHRRKRQLGLGVTMGLYGLFGLLPAFSAFVLPPLAFASSLHAVTLLFASLTLAATAGTMLFVREEAEILLHRPVRAEQLLRAKCWVLIAYSLLLALALNAGGLVTSVWNEGNAPWFFVVHAATTLLLMVLSAATIVLVYNVCLRWFGRERFDNLLTLVQMLVTIVMIGASQLLPRMWDRLGEIDLAQGWAIYLPPVWFGALDLVLCGRGDFAALWLPASLAVGVTALVSWLAFVRLSAAYVTGLQSLNESSSPGQDRPRARRLHRLVQAPPLRWWLRDPIERQVFLLTTAYLTRDRETKLKLYPSMAPWIVMPIVMGFTPRRSGDSVSFLVPMGLAYTVMVPLQALMLLRRSEHWRAAAVFQIAPVPHWTALFHGARKAVLLWLALPMLLLATVVLVAISQSALPFVLALPTLVALPLCALLPGMSRAWIPLSMPNEDLRDTSGCLLFALAIGGGMVIGVIASGLHTIGWLWPFVAILTVMSLVVQRWLAGRMRRRYWQPAEV